MNKNIFKYAFINSILTTAYIALIGTFFNFAQNIFGPEETFLIPIAMLLLFVFSAALCGSLVLGRPILWYLDGKKREALLLFAYTLATLFVITILAFIVLYSLR